MRETASRVGASPVGAIGHARLVTHGALEDNRNNQPVMRDGAAAVHNGIVLNASDLWKQQATCTPEFDVDTEALVVRLNGRLDQGESAVSAVRATFAEILGTASVAIALASTGQLVLATNNGSLYECHDDERGVYPFASENHILDAFVRGGTVAAAVT